MLKGLIVAILMTALLAVLSGCCSPPPVLEPEKEQIHSVELTFVLIEVEPAKPAETEDQDDLDEEDEEEKGEGEGETEKKDEGTEAPAENKSERSYGAVEEAEIDPLKPPDIMESEPLEPPSDIDESPYQPRIESRRPELDPPSEEIQPIPTPEPEEKPKTNPTPEPKDKPEAETAPDEKSDTDPESSETVPGDEEKTDPAPKPIPDPEPAPAPKWEPKQNERVIYTVRQTLKVGDDIEVLRRETVKFMAEVRGVPIEKDGNRQFSVEGESKAIKGTGMFQMVVELSFIDESIKMNFSSNPSVLLSALKDSEIVIASCGNLKVVLVCKRGPMVEYEK